MTWDSCTTSGGWAGGYAHMHATDDCNSALDRCSRKIVPRPGLVSELCARSYHCGWGRGVKKYKGNAEEKEHYMKRTMQSVWPVMPSTTVKTSSASGRCVPMQRPHPAELSVDCQNSSRACPCNPKRKEQPIQKTRKDIRVC